MEQFCRYVPNLRFSEFNYDWFSKTIRDVSDVVGGGTPETDKKSYWNGNIQWFTPSEIGLTKYVSRSQRTITELGLNKSSAKLLPKGTLLLSTRATVGECSISMSECTTNQGFQSLIPKNIIDRDFLYYLIQTKKHHLIKRACGSTFLEISNSEVKNLSIAIPREKEQRKIGRFLSLIDERISTQSKIIEKLQSLMKSICNKLFGDLNWEKYRIGDIGTLGRGRVISTSEINSSLNPKYPVYSSQTSNNGVMGYIDTYEFNGEYITWTTDGANAGTVFYRNGKFNCTNVCGTIKLKNAFDAYFVAYALQQAAKKYVSTNLANPKLMNNVMADIHIYCPNLTIQKRISSFIRLLNEKIAIEEQILNGYVQMKKYLLANLFI